MSIILSVLKIIGITLLVLLILFILLLCLILFVPIRYKVYAGKDEAVCIKAKITYLFHVITVPGGYMEEKMSAKIKVFGLTVKDFFPSEEKLKKQEEKQRKKEEKKKKKEAKLKKKLVKKAKNKKEPVNIAQNKSKPVKEEVKSVKETVKPVERKPVEKQPKEPTQSGNEQGTEKEAEPKEEKESFLQKLTTFVKKLIDKIKNIKYTICNLVDKIVNIKETVLWYYNLFQEEATKRALKSAKTQGGRFLKHIKPRKFKGYVEFGFDDPATTGDIFGKLCMFYPIYADNVVIIPDFERNVLKGELELKGRIYIITLLHIAWKVIFDQDIRKLYEILTGGVKHER